MCRRIPGCCAVGSAPALGAGGREFESRHSDHKKSHDEPFINAVLSWLYLLYIGLKMAGKCDKNATNSGKTCFVRQCAPLFCMPCPISYGCIMGCYMPLLRGYRKSLYPYNPAYGGAVSDTDPIHKGMNQIHNPNTKKCQHRHKRQWGHLPDCTDLCNRLKIERVAMPSKLSVFQLRPLPGLADSTITEL